MVLCRYIRLHAADSFKSLEVRTPQGQLRGAWPLVVHREPRIFVHERSLERHQPMAAASAETEAEQVAEGFSSE